MSVPGENHIIQLELRFDGAAPTGSVRLGDGDPCPFSGWIGLDRWLLPMLGTPWRPGALATQRDRRPLDDRPGDLRRL